MKRKKTLTREIRYVRLISVLLGGYLAAVAHTPAAASPANVKALSLNDCITAAWKQNPKIIEYRKKIEQSREKAAAVRFQYIPAVDVSLGYDYLSYVSQSKQRYLGDSPHDQQFNINLKQPLFPDLWRTSMESQAAEFAVQASVADFQDAAAGVVYDVKNFYYRLLYAVNIVKSKKEHLARTKAFYNTSAALYRRTKLPRLESLLRIKVQVDEVGQELLLAEQNADVARKKLLTVMGRTSGEGLEIQDTEIPGKSPDREKALHAIIENNPRMQRAAREIERAKMMIESTQTGFFPRISAHGGYKYEWAAFPGGDEWYLGLGASFPLTEVIKTGAAVNQARAYLEELKANQKGIELTLKRDFDIVCRIYEAAQKRITLAEAALKNSQRSLKLFDRRYRDGLVSVSDMLDIQKTVASAQTSYASVVYELQRALADIEKLRGYTDGLK